MLLWTAALAAREAGAAAPAAGRASGRLPVKEVTVFKDGHAFVLKEGEMPVDGAGNVVLDRLPAPVLGTFWPYSAGAGPTLASVVASPGRSREERPAQDLRELLEANPGAEVTITDVQERQYRATILEIPRAAPPLSAPAAASAPFLGAAPASPGSLVYLRTEGGVMAVRMESIKSLTFLGAHRALFAEEKERNLLTLRLDWGKEKPRPSAAVGMVYLQKGLRWIPGYRVDLDGKGRAAIRLQATLINELEDLEDAAVHLVIGVPSIAFKETLDPLSLQKVAAQLSQYFQEDARTAFAFSNAIMTQAARMGELRQTPGEAGAPEPGEEMAGTSRAEDLFVFTVRRVTLKKGERMVLPVTAFDVPYRDVFSLDLPFTPPPELRQNLNSDQERELARLFHAPKVMHQARLQNRSRFPLTTAPALILREGALVAQGMMRYTPVGGSCDLPLTTAVNIQVRKREVETRRTPDAARWGSSSFIKIDLEGKVTLRNHLDRPVDLEVTRHVAGNAGAAGAGGVVEQVNAFEDGDWLSSEGLPSWWRWSSWPRWWHHLNGVGRIAWKLRLEPGQETDLGYSWHYFWG